MFLITIYINAYNNYYHPFPSSAYTISSSSDVTSTIPLITKNIAFAFVPSLITIKSLIIF